ncbi:site-specific integrase [Burkholderia ambifaria]|uniref:site-specific integrase n=1 Tax=Burkholderia ambifaria TaxID=152480 RepID=UPI00339544D9
MRNYAHWLANFLEWAERRNVNLSTCTYQVDLLERYQREMLTGTWSRDHRPLSTQTINPRMQLACDYLTWMAEKGHRRPFEAPQAIQPVRYVAGVGQTDVRRAYRLGIVRRNKRHIRLPTDDTVRTWLQQVYKKFGDTLGLMCETVLLTAVRREEVACWRIDTLPENPGDWHVSRLDAPESAQRVLIDIRFGTKGASYGHDHGDKIGPTRSIWIPLDLAERLHGYRQRGRNQALRHWVFATPDTHEQRQRVRDTPHLFLDEVTGKRISARQLYRAWTGVTCPVSGWSPHRGRDWWACTVLWRELQRHEQLARAEPGVTMHLLESCAMSVIRLLIQPQLGHAHDSTTLIYLQWVMDAVGHDLPMRYELACDPTSSFDLGSVA